MPLLPSSKSEKVLDLAKQVILVYGPPKIGKSTLCSKFDNPIFLATEPGLNHLEVYKANILNWVQFLEACSELAATKHNYSTVIIDTIDALVLRCVEYVCQREKINHPSDYEYGKGWSMVTQELKRALAKLSLLPYGLILVSHSKVEEVKTKSKTYNKETLTITGENRRAVLSLVDIILFVTFQEDSGGKETRIIRTAPSLYWDAGDRSGLLPEMLPLDYNELSKYFKKGE